MRKILTLVTIGLLTFFMGCSNNSSVEIDKSQQNSKEVISTDSEIKDESSSSTDVIENTDNESKIDLEAGSRKEEYLKKCSDLDEHLNKTLAEKYAGTSLEMREAAVTAYENWDALLNEIYEVLIVQLPDDEMEELRQEEVNWISERDTKAQEEANKFAGGTLESIAYESSLVEYTKNRCYELINNYMQ